MFDQLQKKYRVIFEGQPAPIFYKYFYPTGNNHGILWDLFNYSRGLKKDKQRDSEQYDIYSNMLDASDGSDMNLYEHDLRQFLNAVYADTGRTRNAGITAIPSSNASRTNRVTEIIRAIMQCTPGVYKDLTGNIYRRRSKESAHGGGNRSIESNLTTLGARNPYEIRNLDLIIVVDDIVTSGSSFRAMYEFLQGTGFQGQIVNFAYARHFPSEVVEAYLKYDHEIEYEAFETEDFRCEYELRPEWNNEGESIYGVIYDLDQTLIEDTVRDVEFEEALWKSFSGKAFPYGFYDGIKKLMELPIASAIVSNRSSAQLERLFEYDEVKTNLTFPEWPRKGLPRPIFSYPEEQRAEFTTRYYKPHSRGVGEAYSCLDQEYDLTECRIIGVGNIKEDIIAYKAIGIEAVLALWGVPAWLKETARNSWGADFAFEDVHEFKHWLEARIHEPDYVEMGKRAEESDKQQACAYYEKALRISSNVIEAAFRYARLVSDNNEEKATELYRQAIDAGDEYASTNNLALLIKDRDPGEAERLYERSIAAGNLDIATRNLALLVRDREPDRAIDLLARAANAGNSAELLNDLKPMILGGNDRAIQLYDDFIVAKDGRRAFGIAILVEGQDKELAKGFYERAIQAGDEYASTVNLAHLIAADEPERAKELYERAIAAGEAYYATNNLANLIAADEPERAKELYERAIDAGDKYHAPRNLALLTIDNEPDRAIDLLELAAENGNKENLAFDLERVIKDENLKAVRLYEREIVAEEGMKANSLADLIRSYMPEKAEVLYRRAITAGDERYATFNLAVMLTKSNPDESEALYERAIKAGDTESAANNLGTLIVSRDPDRARSLFEQAIEAGDEIYATCNLAHMHIHSDREQAMGLYERCLQNGDETDAKLGLSYLLKDTQPKKASELMEQAILAENIDSSFEFLVSVLAACDKSTAYDVVRYISDFGYRAAWQTLLALDFGEKYNQETGIAYYGQDVDTRQPIPWVVLGPTDGGIMLLAKYAVKNMPFVDGAATATWDDSAVRSWLNGSFLTQAFSPDEAKSISEHHVLGDKLICLSESELEAHVAEKDRRTTAMPTNEISGKPMKWWLRPDGGGTLSAPCVDESGRQAWSFALVGQGVRPVLIYRLQS